MNMQEASERLNNMVHDWKPQRLYYEASIREMEAVTVAAAILAIFVEALEDTERDKREAVKRLARALWPISALESDE